MNLSILDRMFEKEGGLVDESYLEAVQKLLSIIKLEEAGKYDFLSEEYSQLGFLFLKTEKKDWGYFFMDVSFRIDSCKNKRSSGSLSTRKTKFFREPSKMKCLVMNWVKF